MRSIGGHADGAFCLRLDSIAIEDSGDPDHFMEVVDDIVETLGIDPRLCSVLIDFGDVSVGSASIDEMVARSQDIIAMLEELSFRYYVIAGCSLPGTTNHAVGHKDDEAIVVRKESLAWKSLREDLGNKLVSGDYGVRGPSTTEIRSKYTNGKIRYTIENAIFVVRGHAFNEDGDYSQLSSLCQTLATSVHYLGVGFSWGDAQIEACRGGGRTGNLGHWIAIDTNHHLTLVVQEVEEFERGIEEVTTEGTDA